MEFVKRKLTFISISVISVILFIGCAGKKPMEQLSLEERFKRGHEYLDKEKYYNAQQEFQIIVLSGSHTDLGDDAQFYLAETYFKNKEYILAISEYERLTRKMKYSEYVEKARWRICEAYVKDSPNYYHDQTSTDKALQKLQEFIDEYPNSEFSDDAKDTIQKLRNKLAEKVYHSGELYIKLHAFDSAIIAFQDLLDRYYDTDVAEKAYVGIVQSYAKMNDAENANKYLNDNSDKIKSTESKQKVQNYLNSIVEINDE